MRRRRSVQLVLSAVVFCAAATVATTQERPAPVPSYRNRLLGVYDVATGDPIEGAGITDLKSGLTARTTKTGTVSLLFLPEGRSTLRIRKLGFEPVDQPVDISPTDTVP